MTSETSDECIWGPEIDRYSRNFDPYISEISWQTFTDRFSETHETLTLDGLETILGLSDPRRSDFHQAELSIGEAMKMLQLYTMEEQPIFKHYWGFLCVRYILHTTCLTLLEEMGILDEVLRLLPPSVDWNKFSDTIAVAACAIAADTVTATAQLKILNQIFSETNFSEFEGAVESDAGFLIRELWMDRGSFFTLCSNGLLPGCALLFLAAWKWVPTEPRNRFRGYCLFLQDLCYRLYLVGSNEDLQVVHRVCMYMIDKDMEWDKFRERFVSSEDSHDLTRAYGELLSASRSDQSIIEVLSVDIMGLVGKFVLEMLMIDDTATLQEVLVVNHQNFEFLWLFLEHRDRVSLVDGDKIKLYASTIFMITANNQTHLVKTREDQLDFARMLAASEVVSLTAHILLMAMDKGYVFRGMEEWGILLGSIFRFGQALDKSISHASELFYGSRIEWAKFLDQLGLEVRLGVRDVTGKAKFLREMVLNMTNWAKNRGFLGADNLAPQRCGYLRCVQPLSQERALGAYFLMTSEASDEDLWGPEIDQYSRNFDPYISEISWQTVTVFSGTHETLTLDSLETIVGLSDPRRSDFDQAELSISEAMKMLQLYTTDGQPILRHYWGFLCVRYILHTTCLTLLEEVGMLDEVLGLLPPSVDWNEFSDAIADAASGLTADTVTTVALPRILNQVFSETHFSEFEGAVENDAEFLIRELWMDRQSFFTLCSSGLLPGCALLFLAAWKWFPTEPRDRFRGYCLFLQDLCYRLYLVGSNEDLQVVHLVCMYIIDKIPEWDMFWERFVSPEDSRELAWAYGELLSASRSDQSIIEILSVEVMGLIGKFVLEMLIVDDTASLQEILVVNHQNFEFLWLFLEHRGRVSLVDGARIKGYATIIFMVTANNQKHLVKTREDQVDFARMLAASEVVSLMTHTSLMVMDKGKALS